MSNSFIHRQLRVFLTVFLGAFLLVGCTEQPTRVPPASAPKTPPPPGKPESLLIIHKVIPDTPEKALQSYQEAVALQDWDKCWLLLHKRSQDAWDARAAGIRKTFATLPEDSEAFKKANQEISDMGYALFQGRAMTGRMLMVGTCRREFATDADTFRAFAKAERRGYQQMGRNALVDFHPVGQEQTGHVMTVRLGVLWYLRLSPPNVCPSVFAAPESPESR
jgi:hypothetical protein